jgi:hypothetical protein
VICFIYEDCEFIDEKNNIALYFPKNVQQQFIIANLPWKHDHCTKEELFQDIVDKYKILHVVDDKEKDESILELETPHPIKDNIIIEKPIINYIETWFQSIFG